MGRGSIESDRSGGGNWQLVIPALGVLLLVSAAAKSTVELADGDGLLEAALDLLLLSAPGLVMVSVGRWLPSSSIRPVLYPRIVAWVFGGIAVMGIVLGLRVVHPGVTVDYTFGTQAVLLSIGSIAGLGIGVHQAQALTHAKALGERNEELQRTEQQLEEAVTQLEASNEQLEQFAYAASHDLQEPLRMVTRYLELAEDRYGDELDEDCREFIGFAVDGAARMGDMIDGLLEYSRVDTQGGSFEAVDMDAVLDDVLTDLQFKIAETDTAVTREPLPSVYGDRTQLQQLLQNLLTNAIEYSGNDPPRIHVSAEEDGSEWVISVRDDGIGIDSEHADEIFDIFQRLHSVEEHAGSGIGLALCERIVERHGVRPNDVRPGSTDERGESIGGDIWVDSEPGAGSTFRFTLAPAADRAGSVGEAASTAQPSSRTPAPGSRQEST